MAGKALRHGAVRVRPWALGAASRTPLTDSCSVGSRSVSVITWWLAHVIGCRGSGSAGGVSWRKRLSENPAVKALGAGAGRTARGTIREKDGDRRSYPEIGDSYGSPRAQRVLGNTTGCGMRRDARTESTGGCPARSSAGAGGRARLAFLPVEEPRTYKKAVTSA